MHQANRARSTEGVHSDGPTPRSACQKPRAACQRTRAAASPGPRTVGSPAPPAWAPPPPAGWPLYSCPTSDWVADKPAASPRSKDAKAALAAALRRGKRISRHERPSALVRRRCAGRPYHQPARRRPGLYPASQPLAAAGGQRHDHFLWRLASRWALTGERLAAAKRSGDGLILAGDDR